MFGPRMNEHRPPAAVATTFALVALVAATVLSIAPARATASWPEGLPAAATIDPLGIVQEATLIDPAGTSNDNFGLSVAIDGGTAVVAAPFDDTGAGEDAGSVHVFVRIGAAWTRQAQLVDPSGAAGDFFGGSVAIDGDTVVVGTPGIADPNIESAHVFLRTGTAWTHQAELSHPSAATNVDFGSSVAIDGDTVIVGADQDDTPGGTDAGSAHVFVRTGATWAPQAMLTDPIVDDDRLDGFGNSVAIDGDTAVIGAPFDDSAVAIFTGAVHVFVRTGTTWAPQALLTDPAAARSDLFGASVGIDGETVIVGAPSYSSFVDPTLSSAHVFVRTGTAWTREAELIDPTGAIDNMFGSSVTIDDDIAIVGVPGDNFGDHQAQSAHVFRRTASAWSPEAELTIAGGLSIQRNGLDVAVDGDTAIVGSPGDSTSVATDAGSAQAFRMTFPAATTISVTSSPNPSAVGATVTVTATVSGGDTTPTGAVTFFNENHDTSDEMDLGSGLLDADGRVTITTSALPGGSNSITAVYSGDASHGQSLGSVDHVVNVTATATVVAASPNPSTVGESVTFAATVTSGESTPLGNVAFSDGSTHLGIGTLDGSGVATFSTSALAVGSHEIVAHYYGQGPHAPSTGTVTHVVRSAPDPTTTAVTSAPNPSTPGASVTFTATVTGGSLAPTGTVTFSDGATVLGVGTVDAGGVASLSTMDLSVGTHVVTATYSGDGSHGASSGVVSHLVGTDVSATALTAAPNPSTVGDDVTFTATVSGGSSTPTGTVEFSEGGSTLATATLDTSGVATFATADLSVGAHDVVATYPGDATHDGSAGTVTQVVGAAATSSSLTSSPNPSTVGDSVTFTAMVAGGPSTPTGVVIFAEGGSTLGTDALDSSGVATFSTDALPVGAHTIVASYAGDETHRASQASTAHTVLAATPAVQVSTAPNPSSAGQTVTITATVTGGPGLAAPTGTVSFAVDDTALGGPVILDATGKATLTASALAVGDHTVTAAYSGDRNHRPGAAATSHTVLAAATTTAVATSPNPSLVGQAVSITATVTSADPGAGLPTGTVRFRDGTTQLGTATVDASGTATLSTSALAAGDHAIVAVYAGDATHASSEGSAVHTVCLIGTTLTAHPAVLQIQPLRITLRLSGTLVDNGGQPVAGRTIRFTVGGRIVCAAITRADGRATCTGLGVWLLAVLNLGYDAHFDGDAVYQSGRGHGGLLG